MGRTLSTLLQRLEPKVLIGILAASVGLWIFVEVAEKVTDGDTRKFDQTILTALHISDPAKLDWFSEFVRDISGLGGAGVLSLLVIFSATFLYISNKAKTALFVTAATLSGVMLSTLLKFGFDRPRPDIYPHLTHVYGTSFPSGHAMVSAIVYLTLGSLLARTFSKGWSKIFIMVVAVTVTGLIGLSRLYLGVHWPSDILAGWVAGSLWALVSWIFAHLINLEDGINL